MSTADQIGPNPPALDGVIFGCLKPSTSASVLDPGMVAFERLPLSTPQNEGVLKCRYPDSWTVYGKTHKNSMKMDDDWGFPLFGNLQAVVHSPSQGSLQKPKENPLCR